MGGGLPASSGQERSHASRSSARARTREHGRHIVRLGCWRPASACPMGGRSFAEAPGAWLPGSPAFIPGMRTAPAAEDGPRGNGIEARAAPRPQVWGEPDGRCRRKLHEWARGGGRAGGDGATSTRENNQFSFRPRSVRWSHRRGLAFVGKDGRFPRERDQEGLRGGEASTRGGAEGTGSSGAGTAQAETAQWKSIM